MPGRHCRNHKWWHGDFQGCGYRITASREAILDILSKKSDKHLSAEEIYILVHKSYPAIGLTTVYRTLELLVEMGMLSKFDFGDGRARYELNNGEAQKGHHHHLICTECKRVINYNDFIDEELKLLKKTESELQKKYNFEIKSHSIQFLGLCESCKTK